MDLQLLHTFKTVVEQGGALKAAAALGCAQSNVSTRLQQLEQRLGVALFERQGKRLALSEAGRRYLDYADRILALVDEAAQAARAPGVPSSAAAPQPLRLGSMESTAAVHLPALLAALDKSHPGLVLHVEVAAEPELSQLLLERRLDLAVSASEQVRAGLHYEPAFDEPLVLVAREDPAELLARAPQQPVTLLAFREGCPYRALALRWIRQRRIACARVQSYGTFAAVLGCAAAGMGLAVLPRRLVQAQADQYPGLRHYRPRDLVAATSYFIYRQDSPPTPQALAAMRLLRRVAA